MRERCRHLRIESRTRSDRHSFANGRDLSWNDPTGPNEFRVPYLQDSRRPADHYRSGNVRIAERSRERSGASERRTVFSARSGRTTFRVRARCSREGETRNVAARMGKQWRRPGADKPADIQHWILANLRRAVSLGWTGGLAGIAEVRNDEMATFGKSLG